MIIHFQVALDGCNAPAILKVLIFPSDMMSGIFYPTLIGFT
jgi:hypothetical protein